MIDDVQLLVEMVAHTPGSGGAFKASHSVVGDMVGVRVGKSVGVRVGSAVGDRVGARVGCPVGDRVGSRVGCSVGLCDG